MPFSARGRLFRVSCLGLDWWHRKKSISTAVCKEGTKTSISIFSVITHCCAIGGAVGRGPGRNDQGDAQDTRGVRAKLFRPLFVGGLGVLRGDV